MDLRKKETTRKCLPFEILNDVLFRVDEKLVDYTILQNVNLKNLTFRTINGLEYAYLKFSNTQYVGIDESRKKWA